MYLAFPRWASGAPSTVRKTYTARYSASGAKSKDGEIAQIRRTSDVSGKSNKYRRVATTGAWGVGAAFYKEHLTELREKPDGAAKLFQRRQFAYLPEEKENCDIKTLHF